MSKQIDELKKIYQSEPIPKELNTRVQIAMINSIEYHRRKNIRFKYLLSILSSVAVLAIFILSINVSPIFAKGLEEIPVFKNVVKVLTVKKTMIEDDSLHVEIKAPKITGLNNKEIEKEINEEITIKIQSKLDEAKKMSKAISIDLSKKYGEKSPVLMPLLIETDYEIKSIHDVLSIKISTTEIKASSYTEDTYYNIDLKTNKTLLLSDLFDPKHDYINVINEEIKYQIEKEMKEDTNKMYFIGENEFETISANQPFYINEDGKLVIAFSKYEIAPGSMGNPEFMIPTSKLKNMLKENSFIK